MKHSPRSSIIKAIAKLPSLVFPPAAVLEDPLERLLEESRDELLRLRSRALRAAEAVAGMSREDIMETIETNPRLVPLAARVLFLAGMSNQDDMLDLLGTALGDAVREPNRVDEIELIILGLANLRAEHIRVLEVMTGSPKWLRRAHPSTAVETDAVEEPQPVDSTGWNPEAIARVLALTDDVAWQLVLALHAAGFVRSRPRMGLPVGDPNTGYEVSGLGLVVLEAVETHRQQS